MTDGLDVDTTEALTRKTAHGIRKRVLEHTIKNGGGYLSQACSAAETLATLYTRVLNIGPSAGPRVPIPFPGVPGADNPDYFTGGNYNGERSPEYDRFFFSPAHYALVLYATLIETGRMSEYGLAQFNRDGSTVEMIGAEHSPGMEFTTGSLAQGLSQAMGVAMARKLRGDSGKCWVYMSDGEFQEGQTWETFEGLSFYKMDKIGIYVDVNGQQCDGRMKDVMDLGNIGDKLRAFGATVVDVDGHHIDELEAASKAFEKDKPLVILAHTSPYQGIDQLKDRAPKFHYFRFRDNDEMELYKGILTRMAQEV
ncbi:transketolase [Alicyclobacillus sp. ALC3]|uniref:transketolase n=1 Tax=Alicyclobacillus sp. ALC3 TaxID=2796143 RepID=UPI002378E337|nr:hypothetical protein [Alicyclobacillus sp. ALC3]WDL98554.1 hypothetical protein JC200_07730 [Alicyclobacillus sp. ALC3]